MMKNSLIILLLSTGLFACNQSSKKQTTADTTQQVADTGKVKQPILDDSIAKSPATTDTSTTKTISTDQLISPGRGMDAYY